MESGFIPAMRKTFASLTHLTNTKCALGNWMPYPTISHLFYLPGNHDAVRPAEPQPMLEPNVQQKFNSTIHVGNPARITLSGIDVLSYHGKGIDDIVPRVEDVTYEKPQDAMKLMLQKRHLAPMWGERNALSPEEEDQMVIRESSRYFRHRTYSRSCGRMVSWNSPRSVIHISRRNRFHANDGLQA